MRDRAEMTWTQVLEAVAITAALILAATAVAERLIP